jgi:hypothetical protein
VAITFKSNQIDEDTLHKLREHIRALGDQYHIPLFHTVDRATRHGFFDQSDLQQLVKRAPIDDSKELPLELTMALFKNDGERAVLGPPVKNIINYAAMLHEFGHILSDHGSIRKSEPRAKNWQELLRLSQLRMVEEHTAWHWARVNALVWTPDMDELEKIAISTHGLSHRLAELGAKCDFDPSFENMAELFDFIAKHDVNITK